MPSPNVTASVTRRAHVRAGSVRPARRDTLLIACGLSWSSVPAPRKRIASGLRVDPSNVSRRTSGNNPTALSRAAEEAYREAAALERVRINAACAVETRLKVATMYPLYDRMTLAELELELKRVTEDETTHDAALDIVQTRILARGTPEDLAGAIAAAHAHANRLHRSIALMELIQERRRLGRDT